MEQLRQQRRNRDQRQRRRQPMNRDLAREQQGQRMWRQHQLFERAVLEIAAEQRVEREQSCQSTATKIVPAAMRASVSASGPSANGNSATTMIANISGLSASPRRTQVSARSRRNIATQAADVVPAFMRGARAEG
jgi:hypothetical protein